MLVYRLVLTGVLGVYLVAILLTGYLVLSPAFDVPLALAGWLLFAGPCLWAVIKRREFHAADLLPDLLRPWPLALVFATCLVAASYFAIAWHVPVQCHAVSLNCLKGYQWTVTDGRFSQISADGVSSVISRDVYVQEVGVHLRSAAAFGMYSLALAWAAAIAFRKLKRSQ